MIATCEHLPCYPAAAASSRYAAACHPATSIGTVWWNRSCNSGPYLAGMTSYHSTPSGEVAVRYYGLGQIAYIVRRCEVVDCMPPHEFHNTSHCLAAPERADEDAYSRRVVHKFFDGGRR